MRRVPAAALAGLLLAAAFPGTGWWWAAVAALALLVAAVRGQRPRAGFGLGMVFGLAAYLPAFSWLGASVGRDAATLLSLYTSVWTGLAAMGTAAVSRLRWWWLWTPSVWVLMEAVSSRVPLGGWGWGRIGIAQAQSPLLPLAALAGVPGLTFAVVLLACAGLALLPAARTRAGARAVAPALALCAVLGAALAVPVPVAAQGAGGPATRQVGIVQGNVPQHGLDFNARRRAVLDNHVRQTLALAAGDQAPPDLVLWPENASDIDPFRDPVARQLIDAAAAAAGAPVLVGAVVADDTDDQFLRNQGIVWDPVNGPGERYTKVNLVPFGEYVPLRPVLAQLVSRFDRVPRDFVPGDRPGVLGIGGTTVGVAICFDIAYDDTVRAAVRGGARMLVVQTNNATFNLTAQPAQQFAISRIRAVEHGRAVAIASTSGLSGIIDPDGTVQPGTMLPELVAGSYTARVVQRDALTVADRLGPWPEALAAALGATAVGAAWFDSRIRGTTRSSRRTRTPALSEKGSP